MNKFIKLHRLLPGDEIVLPKSEFRIVQHHAVYLGQNQAGQDLIIENNVGYGVKLTRVEDFFPADGAVTRINRFQGTPAQREAVVKKAISSLGRSYDLINFNCEHLSNEIRNGSARSRQVEKVGWGIAGILLGLVVFGGNSTSKRRRY